MAKRTVKQIEDEMRAESVKVPCEENGWTGPDDAKIFALQAERNALLSK